MQAGRLPLEPRNDKLDPPHKGAHVALKEIPAPPESFRFDLEINNEFEGEYLTTGVDGYEKTTYIFLTAKGVREIQPPVMLRQLIEKAQRAGKMNPGMRCAAMMTGEKQTGEGKNPMGLFRFCTDPDSKISEAGANALKDLSSTV